MPRISAGILLYRTVDESLQVLLAHPGGPYFKNKDEGAWTILKGEIEPDEDFLTAARREFEEETGFMPEGPFHELTPIKQKGGKIVHAWACEGECNPAEIVSNTFTIEWPPRSAQQREFPEMDAAEFFDIGTAKVKINVAQIPFLDELQIIVTAGD